MADEPDNLVLSMLRDIRAALDTLGRRQEEQGGVLNALRREVHEWQETSAAAAGFSMHANVRHESVDKRLTDRERRIQELERQP